MTTRGVVLGWKNLDATLGFYNEILVLFVLGLVVAGGPSFLSTVIVDALCLFLQIAVIFLSVLVLIQSKLYERRVSNLQQIHWICSVVLTTNIALIFVEQNTKYVELISAFSGVAILAILLYHCSHLLGKSKWLRAFLDKI